MLGASDAGFLTQQPQLAVQVLAGLRFRAQQQVISVMAGISLVQLGTPVTDITITISGHVEQS